MDEAHRHTEEEEPKNRGRVWLRKLAWEKRHYLLQLGFYNVVFLLTSFYVLKRVLRQYGIKQEGRLFLF